MAINKKLKFSWGHIIAALAIIFISYVSFAGLTYLTKGNFILAGIGVFLIDFLLIIFFIVPQYLKGTDENFKTKIIYERILIFTSPIFFVAIMVPYAHFWIVFEQRKQVEATFSTSIKTTKGMFYSYEKYADNRILAYEEHLTDLNENTYRKNNAVEALTLQIIDQNYTDVKKSAFKWIDKASGATVWNVFLIGNIKEVENAIDHWNKSLTKFSSKTLMDEPKDTEPFTSSDPSVVTAKGNLNNLRAIYTTMMWPNAIGIATAILLYIMLLFPYIIQSRNTKSVYRLINIRKKRKSITYTHDTQADNTEDKQPNNEIDKSSNKNNYESFTL